MQSLFSIDTKIRLCYYAGSGSGLFAFKTCLLPGSEASPIPESYRFWVKRVHGETEIIKNIDFVFWFRLSNEKETIRGGADCP